MKISLDVEQQNALLLAFNQMDGYDTIAPGSAKVIRVPYRLGGARRALVRNINTLRASLLGFEEVRQAIFRETWPDLAAGWTVNRADDPENFEKYQAAVAAIVATREEIELLPIPASVLYPSGDGAREFPSDVLALLELRGLVADDSAPA